MEPSAPGYAEPVELKQGQEGQPLVAPQAMQYVQPSKQETMQWIDLNHTDQLSQQQPLLNYQIKGRPAFAFVDIALQQNQMVVAEAGSLLWMDGTIAMSTKCCRNGCDTACWRGCSGQSCCQNEFVGLGPENHVSFGFELPGDMLPFAVGAGNGWMVTSKAFVAGTQNMKVSAKFSGCAACWCSGEGPFLTHITTTDGQPGMFFAGGYGALERHIIEPGKTFIVDAGLFFAAHENTVINIGLAAGCFTCFFGQEGFVMKFQGPGVVYCQSRDPAVFKKLAGPKGSGQQQQGGGAAGAA